MHVTTSSVELPVLEHELKGMQGKSVLCFEANSSNHCLKLLAYGFRAHGKMRLTESFIKK